MKRISECVKDKFIISSRSNKCIIKTDNIVDVLNYIDDLPGFNSISIYEDEVIKIEREVGIDLIYTSKRVTELYVTIEQHLISSTL